jgi:hypothetical protein
MKAPTMRSRLETLSALEGTPLTRGGWFNAYVTVAVFWFLCDIADEVGLSAEHLDRISLKLKQDLKLDLDLDYQD